MIISLPHSNHTKVQKKKKKPQKSEKGLEEIGHVFDLTCFLIEKIP